MDSIKLQLLKHFSLPDETEGSVRDSSEFTVHGAGVTSQGVEVFLRDVWPSREEVLQIEEDGVIAAIFRELKERSKVRAPSLLHPVPGPGVCGPSSAAVHQFLEMPPDHLTAVVYSKSDRTVTVKCLN